MIWVDSVLFSEVLRSTCKTANMTWVYNGTYWCMWFAEAVVWYGYSFCYNSGLVMCTAKKVVYLFTWRLFSILIFIWHDLTRQCRASLNVSQTFQGFSASLKAVHCKMMHTVYWRACRWYDWIGFNSAKLLSSTCNTANINVAMVDSSLPKLIHKLSMDALCIHMSVDGYLWSGFNSAELSTVATLIAPYGGIW